ncbi:MAG: GNAT family N-acetyltransferase [Solirubrobacteraceae bacterium]
MIDVEIADSVARLAAEWDALAERLRVGPFVSPDWVAAHWSCFGSGRLAIVAVRRDGRLGAVLPLVRRGTTARSVTNGQTPGFGVLAEDDELTAHALAALAAQGVSRLKLSYVDRDDPLERAVRRHAAVHRQLFVERVMLRSPYIELDGTLADYRARRRSSFKADLRRRNRRLGELGEVWLDVRDGSRELDRLLAEGWELEASEWKDRLGTAIAARAETRLFYVDIARRAAARGRLRLFFLRLDEAPVAFIFALQQGGVLYLIKGGFDPAHGRMSPGQLLLERVIEQAFTIGLDRIELLGGDEPHKLAWTATIHERLLLQSFARSPVRSMQWAACAYGRPLALRIGLDRAVRPVRDRGRVAAETLRKFGGFHNSKEELH